MNLEVMEGEKKSKQVHTAEVGKNDLESGSSSCTEEQLGYFSLVHLFIYWMLFGQFLLLFLTLFGYDSLRLAIDGSSSFQVDLMVF